MKKLVFILLSVTGFGYPSHILKPDILPSLSKKINKHINKCTTLNPTIFLSILYVESKFEINPKHVNPHDVGIAGINMKWWKKSLNINEHKLRTDVGYSIDVACSIFKIKKKEAKKNDDFWWATYHNNNEPYKTIYINKVLNYYRKIKSE